LPKNNFKGLRRRELWHPETTFQKIKLLPVFDT